jgi:hypothetical protein
MSDRKIPQSARIFKREGPRFLDDLYLRHFEFFVLVFFFKFVHKTIVYLWKIKIIFYI